MNRLESIKPWPRAIKQAWLYRRAVRQAEHGKDHGVPRLGFIVGCGRSGTTILGDLLAQHPQLGYTYEPYHLWAAVDPRADVINLYTASKPVMMLEATDVTEAAAMRFRRAFGTAARRSAATVFVEKTPLNALRLGWVDALAEAQPRYVHIVRDGLEVARSIEHWCATATYVVAGKADLHLWWGRANAKWDALIDSGIERGDDPGWVHTLGSDFERGVYEWVWSLEQVERQREVLGPRLLELRYEDLCTDPRTHLKALAGHLGVREDPAWLEAAAQRLHPPVRRRGEQPALPDPLAIRLQRWRKRYGYDGP